MFRLRNALFDFMRGRYGKSDGLNRFLLVLWLASAAVNIFVRTPILSALGFVLALIALFRLLSRNIPARAREELTYQRIKTKITDKFRLLKNRWRDRKTHVYRICPYCKSVVRLPKKKGSHGVLCPCCRRDFRVKII